VFYRLLILCLDFVTVPFTETFRIAVGFMIGLQHLHHSLYF